MSVVGAMEVDVVDAVDVVVGGEWDCEDYRVVFRFELWGEGGEGIRFRATEL
jgi:hypothetical protein